MVTTERYSMNDFKPLTLDDKKLMIERSILNIEDKRRPLILRKQELEKEAGKLNNIIRKQDYKSEDYNSLCDQQDAIRTEKYEIEKQLAGLKEEQKNRNAEKNNVTLKIKRMPNEKAKNSLLEMRDKYMSFAADTTRVSSMRAMSSRFVEEIQRILTDME